VQSIAQPGPVQVGSIGRHVPGQKPPPGSGGGGGGTITGGGSGGVGGSGGTCAATDVTMATVATVIAKPSGDTVMGRLPVQPNAAQRTLLHAGRFLDRKAAQRRDR
jgi:hypothetical protein